MKHLQQQACSEFDSIVKGNNIMTPYFIECHRLKNGLIAEITEGVGFTGQAVYGVTVADTITKTHRHELSELCFSWEEVNKKLSDLGGI
jgi:hypothetical protein